MGKLAVWRNKKLFVRSFPSVLIRQVTKEFPKTDGSRDYAHDALGSGE